MNIVVKKLISGWHLMRIIRLGIGVMASVEAIRTHDYAIGLLSVFFLYQAITDTGCCGATGCVVRPENPPNEKTKDISYEEIK